MHRTLSCPGSKRRERRTTAERNKKKKKKDAAHRVAQRAWKQACTCHPITRFPGFCFLRACMPPEEVPHNKARPRFDFFHNFTVISALCAVNTPRASRYPRSSSTCLFRSISFLFCFILFSFYLFSPPFCTLLFLSLPLRRSYPLPCTSSPKSHHLFVSLCFVPNFKPPRPCF